ncbi:N-acetyl-gamma-glutamyl-phosphate reductase [Thermosporothrix hazakensis]|jgi:N-acetyl-gamma-glutamyl-phosphate/LysW-gamma-L-alpha-aminoadipyl-6-phosphate reductase|uniref:Putative [LysW]-L-2-aminoadipate 6-phosphate reductase n=2 Tax=Thermosporothrix TaxID=768650 RepID=A0A326UF26_THEHA|nr:N-acetyl-gamma-glutamyl-phosphate reductase [Thermosporothrix hazakensis]PZW25375.1 N-acetyl-gamma-glutamyl-phosphate reductase [Thermosporothrix hazakensis]BBH90708.1 N-acetyl-gamma-glutamyl-phosphate reductase [Thermosporothrix sp. COM3]GCE48759.1 N-acetyl-gamma-glutamyl-phosphate reductase [Thermosporothrix hazakensis]
MSRIRAAIVGGSGYTGGELARLLLFHPEVEITQVASGSRAGQFLHSVHPNLRKLTGIRFCRPEDLMPCDVLFLCLPHGASAGMMEHYRTLAPRVIDLSADFRLRSSTLYQRWYGGEHPATHLLGEAVYGLPELHRAELSEATLVSGTGCMATASILGLAPLYRAGLVNEQMPLVVEAKIGSSAAGAAPGASSHHPDRSGAVRSFQPTGHRHSAELIQELGVLRGQPDGLTQSVAFSATAVELVRGILVTAHVFLNEQIDEKVLWRVYREAYGREPFIRIVKERSGVYRYPEPKILAGSNFCDIGFELDAAQRRVVVMAALDNLMKGAAGNAVQAMNCMFGLDETAGLLFPGLHPV